MNSCLLSGRHTCCRYTPLLLLGRLLHVYAPLLLCFFLLPISRLFLPPRGLCQNYYCDYEACDNVFQKYGPSIAKPPPYPRFYNYDPKLNRRSCNHRNHSTRDKASLLCTEAAQFFSRIY